MTLEFKKHGDELIVVYSPMYGADEILDKITSDDGYSIKNTFWIDKNLLRVFDIYDEDSICFSIGASIYFKFN